MLRRPDWRAEMRKTGGMLTILGLWAVASVPLGILVGTVIRKMDEAPSPRGSGSPRRSAIRRRLSASRLSLSVMLAEKAKHTGLQPNDL
jgi:hypothetical protein